MNRVDVMQCLSEIIDSIPEGKLEVLLDFAVYLKEKGQAEDFQIYKQHRRSTKSGSAGGKKI